MASGSSAVLTGLALLSKGVAASTFRPGDAFKGTISPLHSGEPGGSYFPPQVDLSNPIRK
jgi:hypothetical protein